MTEQQRVFHDIVNPIIAMAIQARKFEEAGYPTRWIAREILKLDTVDLTDEQVDQAVNIWWDSLTCEIPPDNAPGREEVANLLVAASVALYDSVDPEKDAPIPAAVKGLADDLVHARDRLMGDTETLDDSEPVQATETALDDGSTPEPTTDTTSPSEGAVEAAQEPQEPTSAPEPAQPIVDEDDEPYGDDDIAPKEDPNRNQPVEGMAGFKSTTADED